MFGMMNPEQTDVPTLIETLVTLATISAHILLFALIAKYFPIFEHHPETVDYSLPSRPVRVRGVPGQAPDRG
jgi:hypothetical protein